MGSVYRRRVCRTCKRGRLKECLAAGHDVVQLPTWWIKYYEHGKPRSESAETTKKTAAEKTLRSREGAIADGRRLPKKVKFTFDDGVELLINNYTMHKRRSLKTLTIRLEKHIKPFFKGELMADLSEDVISAYIVKRQGEGASNGTINRELTALKRMFTLALRARKIQHAPFIEVLRENNVRTGFFEPEQADNLKAHLPEYMGGIVDFARITGWRTPSEILPLEWRHVRFDLRQVRLDPGTTKNDEGRVFPITRDLRIVLEAQKKAADQLKKAGTITPYVFFYPSAGRYGGRELQAGRQITESGFNKAWREARTAAGCPDRIPHDFRRTAVRTLEKKGISRSVAMKLTGHKTEAVYRRYAIVSSEDLRDAARRLDERDSYTDSYIQPGSKPARTANRAKS